MTFVINFEIPNEPETYVHRIGRTGRAEKSGIALSFCDKEKRAYVRDHKLINRIIPVITEHPFHTDHSEEKTKKNQIKRKQQINNQQQGQKNTRNQKMKKN